MNAVTAVRAGRAGSLRGLTVSAALLLALVVSMAVAVTMGSSSVPLDVVLEVVGRRMHLVFADVSLIDDQVVWQLRMPRVVAAAAVGAGLALIGAVLQSVTRNALADPYILGVAGGASVGAVAVIVLGVSVVGFAGGAAMTAGAFAGAFVALVVVLALATGRGGTLAPTRTILAGVVVTQVCTAITSFLVMTRGDGDAARRVLAWTLGSLAGARWTSAVVLLVVAAVATLAALTLTTALDAFAFGETSARSLGVPVERVRWLLIGGTAFVTAVLVSLTGMIGFVGLVVPHVARLLVGPSHARLLPASVLLGALLLLWADTGARLVLEGQEVPIGVVTAAVGAPVLGWLLRRRVRAW